MQRVSLAFKAKPKHCRVIHLMAQTHQNIYLMCSQADIDALAMFCAGGFCGSVGKAPVLALGQCLRPSGAPATPPAASVPRAIPHLVPSWAPEHSGWAELVPSGSIPRGCLLPGHLLWDKGQHQQGTGRE